MLVASRLHLNIYPAWQSAEDLYCGKHPDKISGACGPLRTRDGELRAEESARRQQKESLVPPDGVLS